jgi:hypothetical protein
LATSKDNSSLGELRMRQSQESGVRFGLPVSKRAGRCHTTLQKLARALSVVLITLALTACASMTPPERLVPQGEEMDGLRVDVKAETEALRGLTRKEARRKRNEIVAARKYAIDLAYTKYESDLTREAQITDFAARASSLALHTTGDLIPVAQTARTLNGIGTGVGSLDDIYNAQVLRAQVLENIQSSMRTARHERAVVIYSHMHCSINSYPLAIALSDLEAYYRAGTFAAGVLTLKQTVQEKEKSTAADAEAQKGGANAQAQLAGQALEAGLKAQTALKPADPASVVAPGTNAKVKTTHKCTLVDE